MRKMMNNCYAWKPITADLRRAVNHDRIKRKTILYGMAHGRPSESAQEKDKIRNQLAKYRRCA